MQVNQTYTGNRYEITLIADDEDGIHGSFELIARHIDTGRQSCVTNNNHVIAEFIEPIMGDDEVGGSTYIVNTPGLFQELVDHAIKLLEDKTWCIKHLELAFDDDRKAGEWENTI